MRGETVLLELQRQYRCAAYNTLIAAVSCTQTDAKFYNFFLFTENITKVLSIPHSEIYTFLLPPCKLIEIS